MQVLSRRTKNNPVLIGEPGVGKTAIVEGLAIRIANRDVPAAVANGGGASTVADLAAIGAAIIAANSKTGSRSHQGGHRAKRPEGSSSSTSCTPSSAPARPRAAMDAGNLLKPAWREASCKR